VPDAPAALVSIHPLTPLAERDRMGWRPARRAAAVLAACFAIAAAVPLLGAALVPAAPHLQPLAGGPVGAATEPRASARVVSSELPETPETPVARQPGDVATGATPVLLSRIARDSTPPAIATLTGYGWPLSAGRISLPFKAIPGGEWNNGGKLFHDGVDMASFCGAPVVAAHDGVVLAAGRHFDDVIGWIGDLGPYYDRLNSQHRWGNLPIVVVIDDGNGYRSIYAHFHDITVKPGQSVRGGQLIGHEGRTGHASGCHVHYGLFSPAETGTFGTRADIVRQLKVPTHEVARIDPLLVLPGGDVALRTRSIGKAIKAAAGPPAQPPIASPRPISYPGSTSRGI
jgi:murein DD-endopeptidase MepM/ murein hydrolase activator NlpD